MCEDKVLKVVCPHCGTAIWVDTASESVIKSERAAAAKPKESLDDLLHKEKKKVEGFATKFEATAALEQKKKDKAREAFEKAMGKTDQDAD